MGGGRRSCPFAFGRWLAKALSLAGKIRTDAGVRLDEWATDDEGAPHRGRRKGNLQCSTNRLAAQASGRAGGTGLILVAAMRNLLIAEAELVPFRIRHCLGGNSEPFC